MINGSNRALGAGELEYVIHKEKQNTTLICYSLAFFLCFFLVLFFLLNLYGKEIHWLNLMARYIHWILIVLALFIYPSLWCHGFRKKLMDESESVIELQGVLQVRTFGISPKGAAQTLYYVNGKRIFFPAHWISSFEDRDRFSAEVCMVKSYVYLLKLPNGVSIENEVPMGLLKMDFPGVILTFSISTFLSLLWLAFTLSGPTNINTYRLTLFLMGSIAVISGVFLLFKCLQLKKIKDRINHSYDRKTK